MHEKKRNTLFTKSKRKRAGEKNKNNQNMRQCKKKNKLEK
jgi:hypothetical protein